MDAKKRLLALVARPKRVSALFGVPGLRSPSDCERLARRAIAKTERLASRAVDPSSSATAVVGALDGISEAVCGVLDAMELARNVHPDKEFVAAADGAYQLLGAHMETLNVDARLHGAVAAALDDPSSALSAEQRRFAHVMRAEFEHDGVHLRADERRRLLDLRARAERLGAQFSTGCDGGPCSVGGEGVWVERATLVQAMSDAATLPRRGALALVPADGPRLRAALRCAATEHERRQLHLCSETLAPENRAVLDALLETRHAVAGCLGHPSYAHLTAAHNSMEADPAFVAERLRALAAAAAPRAQAELAELTAAKARAEPPGARVRAWDLPFYTEAVRRDVSAVDDAELAQYFGRQACLDGLELVLKRAFGLVLRRAAAADGELWHASVRKTVLCRAATAAAPETPLGVLYLDLFPRRGKTPAAAVYTLRGGRVGGRRAAADDDDDDAAGALDDHPQHELLHLDLPAAVLVCDLPPGDGAALRHSQLEMLYHEAGHAVHALVARTETQHFSGVRTALDFVEAPALLMEHFAYEPRALCAWARRGGADGAPMAPELARRLRRARRAFVGLETEAQVLHSLVDLELHGDAPPRGVDHTAARVRALHGVTSVAAAEGTHWHSSFRHLASYGGAYYSYLWARSIARRVWRGCFAADPLGGAAGRRWCDVVLRHGGAREPRELLREMLATAPKGAAAPAAEDEEEEAADAALDELTRHYYR